jgi:glucan phosphoethanolaminetransferase (alkaline phosphatase superfamily)
MPARRSALSWFLIAVVVAGLVIDAIVHFDLASDFAGNKTSTLSEADLFRAEAVVSLVVALLVVLLPRWYTAALAFLVGASAAAVAIITRYSNVGKIGPIPNLYDPYWAPTGKVVSVIGEAAAALAALALLVALRSRSHRAEPSLSRV